MLPPGGHCVKSAPLLPALAPAVVPVNVVPPEAEPQVAPARAGYTRTSRPSGGRGRRELTIHISRVQHSATPNR
jgi:hypothetical protein